MQVAAPVGCVWTVAGGTTWLPLSSASGSGNGVITLTAAANDTGSERIATVTLGSLQATVTQPATECTYGLSKVQIDAPAAGARDTVTVITSCPMVTSSSADWLTAAVFGSSVGYAVAPNSATSQRTATLTIGTIAMPVTQAGVPPPADLSIAKTHAGNFTQGQNGATYLVTVLNSPGAGPTSGPVTVTETIPTGLTLGSMNGGATWDCSALPACTTSSVLNGGSSYPAITVTVSVASNAPAQVTNQASVLGGGSAGGNTSDVTSITQFSCDINADQSTDVVDVQLISNEALRGLPLVHDLNHDGIVNVADAQKAINAALGLGCSY